MVAMRFRRWSLHLTSLIGDYMWYDGNKTLSYNALYNFIIGNRGCGKTYWAKKWAIKDFLKSGQQFIYVRRFETEFTANRRFFTAHYDEFPDTGFSVNGMEYRINDQPAGYGLSLSKANVQKSLTFNDVNKIIFDEFIIDKGYYHYLPNEVEAFLNLYETIARMRENVRVFFLSNSITMINPYFLYFDLSMPKGKTIHKKGDLLIELVQNQEFIEAKKKTRFGKLIEGTSYSKYAIENTFLRDTTEFVRSRPPRCHPYFNVNWKSEILSVWADTEDNLYITEGLANDKPLFALKKDDHDESSLLISQFRSSYYFKYLIEAFENGRLFFTNVKCKNISLEMFSLMIR